MLSKIIPLFLLTSLTVVISEWRMTTSESFYRSPSRNSDVDQRVRVKRAASEADFDRSDSVEYWSRFKYPVATRNKFWCANERSSFEVNRVCDPDGVMSSDNARKLETLLGKFGDHKFPDEEKINCFCESIAEARNYESCKGFYLLSPHVALAKRIEHESSAVHDEVIQQFVDYYHDSIRMSQAGVAEQCSNTISVFVSLHDHEIAFAYGKHFFRIVEGYDERVLRIKLIHMLETGSNISQALTDYFNNLYETVVNFNANVPFLITRETWFNDLNTFHN